MALQIWIPFISDNHNQGLTSNQVTAGTCTYTTGGTLGNAATFNGSSTYQRINYHYTKQMTFAIFVKFNNFSIHLLDARDASGNGYQPMYVGQSGVQAGGGSSFPTIDYQFTAGIWYHLCVVETGTKVQLYVNGNFVNEAAHTGIEGDAYLSVGTRYSGANWFNGQVNDLRVYDHALSAKEIKEISKGLVLHYKLNESVGGQTNLVEGKAFSCYNNYGTGMTYTKTDLNETYMGQKVYRWTYTMKNASCVSGFKSGYHSRGVYGGGIYFGTSGSNIPFVYWVYYRPHTSGLTAGGTASNIGGWTEIPREYVGDGWYRVGQYRTNNTSTRYVTDNIFTSLNWPYAGIDSSCTIDFTEMGYLISGATSIVENFVPGNNTVHDVSGYGNDGVGNGTLTPFSPSDRYDVSTYFGSGKYINAGRGGMITDAISVSVHAYMTSWTNYSAGRLASCTEGGGWNFENGNGYLRFPVYAQGYALPTDTVPLSAYTSGWHHFVGTFNGKSKKACFYRDGQFIASASTTGTAITYANNSVFLGGEAAANQTTPSGGDFNGAMSDFRIYGTTLSPEDVLELYHTPASIDNKGNFYCGELKEV